MGVMARGVRVASGGGVAPVNGGVRWSPGGPLGQVGLLSLTLGLLGPLVGVFLPLSPPPLGLQLCWSTPQGSWVPPSPGMFARWVFFGGGVVGGVGVGVEVLGVVGVDQRVGADEGAGGRVVLARPQVGVAGSRIAGATDEPAGAGPGGGRGAYRVAVGVVVAAGDAQGGGVDGQGGGVLLVAGQVVDGAAAGAGGDGGPGQAVVAGAGDGAGGGVGGELLVGQVEGSGPGAGLQQQGAGGIVDVGRWSRRRCRWWWLRRAARRRSRSGSGRWMARSPGWCRRLGCRCSW